MSKLEQWNNFRYQEGVRQAKAQKATLTAPSDEIALTGQARVWDPSGSTSADTIVMNQRSGDFEAVGSVNSTRLPDKKEGKREGLLSGDDAVQAKAARMRSTQDNQLIHYEGDAILWQGPNRLQANTIDINRKSGSLDARGGVISQLLDKADRTKKSAAFTIVKSPTMLYLDKERIAHYAGGAVLTRGATVVNAREIRAFLKQGDDSSLDKAFADGDVRIVQTATARTRTGKSDHAEYYPADGKILLNGGQPELNDSIKGTTKGKQLIYFANNDRLLVEGVQGVPGESKLLRN
jgi:lipopolysaccharide export system protein LptA